MNDFWRPRLKITTGRDSFYVTTVAQYEQEYEPSDGAETNNHRIILPQYLDDMLMWENYIESFFACSQRYAFESFEQMKRLQSALDCLEPSFALDEIVSTDPNGAAGGGDNEGGAAGGSGDHQHNNTRTLPLGRITIESRVEPVLFWVEPAHVMLKTVPAGPCFNREVAIVIPYSYKLRQWYNIVLSTISPVTDTKLFVSPYIRPQLIRFPCPDPIVYRTAYRMPRIDFVQMKYGRFI